VALLLNSNALGTQKGATSSDVVGRMFAPQPHPSTMNVVKFCLLPVVAFFVIAVLGGYFWANSLPSDWEVTREHTIAATPAEIHPYLEDLRRWEDWGVWYEREPDMQIEYQGEAGVGQVSEWVGKDGAGKNEIIASDVAVGITTRTTFANFTPFEGDITFTPQGDKTLVRWHSHGTAQNIGEKLFGKFADDAMGPDFQANLERLGALVEANK
jgi:carbon monoxide dehydrogenase subunit G